VPVSDEIQRVCRREAEELERYHPRITSCHVQISQLHGRHRQGNLYDIRVNVAIAAGEVVVDRTPRVHAGDGKLELAIREASDTGRRRLEDAACIRRGDVKQHGPPARHGRVP
jgi:hypothetical protein